jgi:hypothetical protein
VTHLEQPELFAAAIGQATSAAHEEHLRGCSACLGEMSRLAELGVAMSLAAPAMRPPQSMLANVRSYLKGDSFAGFARRFADLFDVPVPRAAEILADIRRGDAFEPLMPGMDAMSFEGGPAVTGALCIAARFAPGSVQPEHRHHGDEHVLVLTGAYRDGATGRIVGVGDIGHMPPGSEHSLHVIERGTCIAVILSMGGAPEYLPG